ncbi:MAG: PTS system mannose/fructose/sorbose family transporter subunit IID [Lactobacillus sp.]|nr:PTS system mannose/fructose/sorbose family transporter subunit IID [Lactobacillus sp.]MDN6042718.1 PTS system mannose/fructose/sorbose family transporter subunit IID [Lactobacillus sp.]MDN6052460.1 PTS system mannose/fructose/sorbose family transporter subunit IID [Lactobacillus sp.]
MKTNENTPLTKHDLFRANWRWLWTSQLSWNYEKMMAPGYFYTVLPFLRRFYPQDDELVEMMQMHNQFFNTNAFTGPFIIGMDLAIENRKGYAAKDTVAGIKTGLMGPLASVGDTIFGVIIPTIFGSIGAYMGLKGSPIGAILWLMVNLIIFVLRFAILPLGFYQGQKLLESAEGKLNLVTDSAILLGLTVVGALIPTVITAHVPFVFQAGKVTLHLQTVLNQIMPSLVPALLVALVYWLLGKKHVTATKVILFVLVLGIVLSYCHILG